MSLQPQDKLLELFTNLGYVQDKQNPDIWVFSGNGYFILKRGGAFIPQEIEKVKAFVPETEEQRIR